MGLKKRWISFDEAASTYFKGDQDLLIEYLLDPGKVLWLRLGHQSVFHVGDALADGTGVGVVKYPSQDEVDKESEKITALHGFAMIWGPPAHEVVANGSVVVRTVAKRLTKDQNWGYYALLNTAKQLRPIPVYRKDIWIGRRSIEDFLAEFESADPAADAASALPVQKPLRSDREETLLKVVSGLWALSGLPQAPNTTADKLSALFDGWGWTKPTKGTIADTVLTPSEKIERIRK